MPSSNCSDFFLGRHPRSTTKDVTQAVECMSGLYVCVGGTCLLSSSLHSFAVPAVDILCSHGIDIDSVSSP